MSVEPAEHCGHLCCDTPNMPFHDHFLDPDDCGSCEALREEERRLWQRTRDLSEEVADHTEGTP